MTEVTRHFTATTFVVHDGKILLHRHPKQGLWLPPGGHIERDELPHHAAVREVEEETGLRVVLHSAQEARALAADMGCEVVPQPDCILVEDINPYHQHVDFIYLARLAGDGDTLPAPPFAWYAPGEIEGPDVPRNVRVGAERAVRFFAGEAPGYNDR